MLLKIICAIILIIFSSIYIFYRWKIRHMKKMMKNIPLIPYKDYPWKVIIDMTLRHKKKFNYGKYLLIQSINYINYYPDVYESASQLLKKHPKISHGWFGPHCLVDIREPDYIKIILNSEKCIDRADFYYFPYKTGLLASNGDMWRKHRKLINPAFSSRKIIQFLPSINEKARILVEVLDQYVEKDAFNVVRLLSALTIDSLMKTSFSLDKNFLKNPYDKFFDVVKK